MKRKRRREYSAKASIATKVNYVRKQGQSRPHHCHWPGCDKEVPPAMWGCKEHWYMLPKSIRDEIWAAYRPGQEKDMSPSQAYLKAARRAREWIQLQETK